MVDCRLQVVYNTFQMYLRPSAFSGAPCVVAELDHARTHAFGYAIKLVSAWPGLASRNVASHVACAATYISPEKER